MKNKIWEKILDKKIVQVLALGSFVAGVCMMANSTGQGVDDSKNVNTMYVDVTEKKENAVEVADEVTLSQTFVKGKHSYSCLDDECNSYLETGIVKTKEEAMEQSIVHISMKDSVGSGVIVKIKETEMIVVSNKHLLQKDVEATVTLANGETYQAEVLGLSQQYDIGFLIVQVPEINLREVEQVEPPYAKESLYLGTDVLQYSARKAGVIERYEGYISGEIQYMDAFHSDILQTNCYSAAGMSGGAVFHTNSEFLGMIAGGDVADDATTREAQVTYCIPVDLIWEAYTEVTGEAVQP